MATFKLTPNREISLSVDSPVLNASTPNNTASVCTVQSPSDFSYWGVKLTRQNSTLTVGVTWYRQSSHRALPDNNMYKSLHIIPHGRQHAFTSVAVNAANLQAQSTVEGTIAIADVLIGKNYVFDIVLSTSMDLPRAPMKLSPRPGVLANSRETMLTLLKDIHSVDICFVCEADKSYANVGLWAHRVILSQYKKLANILREVSSPSSIKVRRSVPTALTDDDDYLDYGDGTAETTTTSSTPTTATPCSLGDTAGTAAMIVMPVKKFSLAAMCVLLRFIYTGDVSLSADTSQHAISKTGTSLVFSHGSDNGHKKKETVLWSPFDSESPWKFKDITWEELLSVAEYYGVEDLVKFGEQGVIAAIDQSNVVETLFNMGCLSEKVKDAALNFIVENMAALVVEDNRDKFLPFKDHPACYEMMFEVMRRKAKRT